MVWLKWYIICLNVELIFLLVDGEGVKGLVLDARGAYGLRDLQTDPKNGKNATGSFVVAVGYDLRL